MGTNGERLKGTIGAVLVLAPTIAAAIDHCEHHASVICTPEAPAVEHGRERLPPNAPLSRFGPTMVGAGTNTDTGTDRAPPAVRPADAPWDFWDEDVETQDIVQQNLRTQRYLIAPMVLRAAIIASGTQVGPTAWD